MVMSADLEQGLYAHAEAISGLKCIDASRHGPSRRRVTHDVWPIFPPPTDAHARRNV